MRFYISFLFLGIYGYTTLMDHKSYAIWIEMGRSLLGIGLVLLNGDWFGINTFLSWGSMLVLFYFLITILGVVYFTYLEKNTIDAPLAT